MNCSENKQCFCCTNYNVNIICRFLNCGWKGAKAWDMVQVYASISKAERQRIEHIEMLDEGELLTQLFQHYCMAIAWSDEIFKDIELT